MEKTLPATTEEQVNREAKRIGAFLGDQIVCFSKIDTFGYEAGEVYQIIGYENGGTDRLKKYRIQDVKRGYTFVIGPALTGFKLYKSRDEIFLKSLF